VIEGQTLFSLPLISTLEIGGPVILHKLSLILMSSALPAYQSTTVCRPVGTTLQHCYAWICYFSSPLLHLLILSRPFHFWLCSVWVMLRDEESKIYIRFMLL
jgi:hypothetical protein